MIRRLTLLVSAIALVAGGLHAGAAQAGACDSEGYPATGITKLETPEGTYYVDDRGAVVGNGFWVYKESNGRPGLQRGGRSTAPGPLSETDTCNDGGTPDTLIL